MTLLTNTRMKTACHQNHLAINHPSISAMSKLKQMQTVWTSPYLLMLVLQMNHSVSSDMLLPTHALISVAYGLPLAVVWSAKPAAFIN